MAKTERKAKRVPKGVGVAVGLSWKTDQTLTIGKLTSEALRIIS